MAIRSRSATITRGRLTAAAAVPAKRRGRTKGIPRLRARRFVAECSHNSIWLGGIEVMSPWSADLDLDQFEYRRRNAW
jgi:hypothetical protein